MLPGSINVERSACSTGAAETLRSRKFVPIVRAAADRCREQHQHEALEPRAHDPATATHPTRILHARAQLMPVQARAKVRSNGRVIRLRKARRDRDFEPPLAQLRAAARLALAALLQLLAAGSSGTSPMLGASLQALGTQRCVRGAAPISRQSSSFSARRRQDFGDRGGAGSRLSAPFAALARVAATLVSAERDWTLARAPATLAAKLRRPG
jgi:hypothetical protein